MTISNKVAQFSADSDIVNSWLNGPATGPGSTLVTAGGILRTPSKLIADKDADINVAADGLLAQTLAASVVATTAQVTATAQAVIATTGSVTATTQAGLAITAASTATVGAATATAQATTSTAQAAIAKSAADAVGISLGYQVPVAYVAGISVTLATQTLSYSGQTYAPLLSSLPFTTSGTFEIAKFRLIQGVSGADLAAPGGAALVGFTKGTQNSIPTTIDKKLRETVSIGDYGGKDDWDGTAGTNNYVPFLRIYNDFPQGCTVRLPKLGTGVYMSNGGQYSAPMDGFVICLDEGVSIHNMGGNIPLFSVGVKVNLSLKMRNTGIKTTSDYGPQDFNRIQDKSSFMTVANSEAPQLSSVSQYFALNYSIAWPNGPAVAAVPTQVSQDTITWAANASGLNLSTVPLRPGSVVSCYLADNASQGSAYAGNWIAGVITDNGFSIVRQDVSGGSFTTGVKSGTSAIIERTLTPPTAGNLTYQFSKGLVAVRVHTPTSYSVLVNGIEVARVYDTGGVILSAGFGAGFAQNSNPALIAGMSISKGSQAMGVQPLKIVIVGDSISDPAMGSPWSDYLRQYISGVGGVQFLDVKNIAIAGDNSAMQLQRLQAVSIAGYNYCLIQIGANDIQGGSGVQTLLNNIAAMVLYCKNNGVVPIVGIPTMWYGQAEAITAGNLGQPTSNKENGSTYRASLLRYLASASVAVNLGSLSDFGAIIPGLLNRSQVDSVVYDNIHPTVYGRMLLGYGWAKTLIGQIIPKLSKVVSTRQVSAAWLSPNYGAAVIPDYSVDGDVLRITGVVSVAADPSNGETVFTLPEVYRPTATVTRVVSVANSGGAPSSFASMQIDTGGLAKIYAAAAGTRYIYFGGEGISIVA